jgi:hypothetical protein
MFLLTGLVPFDCSEKSHWGEEPQRHLDIDNRFFRTDMKKGIKKGKRTNGHVSGSIRSGRREPLGVKHAI